MLMKIMDWIAMAALLALAALWGSAANSQFSRFLLACVACLGATAILLQVQARKYVLAVGFIGREANTK